MKEDYSYLILAEIVFMMLKLNYMRGILLQKTHKTDFLMKNGLKKRITWE